MTHYLITGATGYIGSMLIKELYKNAEDVGAAIKVTALVRDARRGNLMLPQEVVLVEADITDVTIVNMVQEPIDYIIHCATTTASAVMVSNPVETADGIVLGTRNMLELARQKCVKGMVYLSSMEVYGNVPDIGRTRTEEELGEIPIESVRSCYPLGKRMAEQYCYSYAKEYGVPVRIARLAQTFGVGVRPEDNRVYMQFARAAVSGQDIVLKTLGLSVGNYCAIEDAVSAILLLLEKGENGESYNVVNEENTMRIREMAELVAVQVADGRIRVRIEPESAEKTGYAPDTGLRLSGEKLRTLGWRPTKGLAEMYRDVLQTLKRSGG